MGFLGVRIAIFYKYSTPSNTGLVNKTVRSFAIDHPRGVTYSVIYLRKIKIILHPLFVSDKGVFSSDLKIVSKKTKGRVR